MDLVPNSVQALGGIKVHVSISSLFVRLLFLHLLEHCVFDDPALFLTEHVDH